jgi:hypothetical protein
MNLRPTLISSIHRSEILNTLIAGAVLLSIEPGSAQSVSPMGHSGQLPDPRFRRPVGLNELQNIANMLAAKNGLQARFTVVADSSDLVPVARCSGSPTGHLITVNPRAARDFPPNTWAFIIGHEMAHAMDARARHGQGRSFKEVEWIADEIGASYAVRAGFQLDAHLGWVFSRPNRGSENYGSEHDRAQNLFRRFRANQVSILHFQERYRMPLQTVTLR